ncbi:MAG: OmpP1/FadL family transporter [Proteobacteria bacterium]|nr:OmpP1/FadL family transporter [Pseudomonadota bacterium]
MLAVLLTAGTACASGFGIYEWSGRGNAMGGATYNDAKDASTISTNPSGMTDLEGTHFLTGVSAIAPKALVDFTDGTYDDAVGKSNVWMPPHAYVTHQLNENFWIGAGIFSRFGLGTEFEETWAGRYNMMEASIESVSFNPVLAYRLNDQWSFAAGPELMYMRFRQSKTVDNINVKNPLTTNSDSHAMLDGDSTAMGGVFAATYKPTDWLTSSLTYRTQVRHKIVGNATFSAIGTLNPLNAYRGTAGASGEITLPDSLTLAVSVKPMDKLTVEADVLYTRWESYQELRIDYDRQLIPGVAASTQSVSEKAWHNTFRYQIGAEYELLDWLDVRAGYIYDQSPISGDHADYMLPTNDRQLYSTGLGLHWDNWLVDLSYIYLQSKERDYNERAAEGVRAGQAHDLETHIVGVSLGYKF